MDVDIYHRPKMPEDAEDKKRFREQYGKGFKDGDVIKYRMFRIDADEVVRKFPDEYSYSPPKAEEREHDKSDASFSLVNRIEPQRVEPEVADPLLDQLGPRVSFKAPSAVIEPQKPGEASTK